MTLERYTDHSEKIDTTDIDWHLGGQTGLTEEEKFILTYFSDIESQTIMYLRDLLHTKAVEDPEVIGFLSMWNYEEYFHGQALARLLLECGVDLEAKGIAEVRKEASFRETLIGWGASLFSKVFSNEFPALFMAWGAINEITTLRGYERLQETTKNPVLKILCERIAKQERRHFAWYFNNSKTRLEVSSRTRKLTRYVLQKFWSPVGSGVKTNKEVARLIQTLFPSEKTHQLTRDVDQRISELPGLQGLKLMENYISRRVNEASL